MNVTSRTDARLALSLLLLVDRLFRMPYRICIQTLLTDQPSFLTQGVQECPTIQTHWRDMRLHMRHLQHKCQSQLLLLYHVCMAGCGWGCAPKSFDFPVQNRNRNYGSQVSFIKSKPSAGYACLFASYVTSIVSTYIRQEHTAIMIYNTTGDIKVEAVHVAGLLFMNNYAAEHLF